MADYFEIDDVQLEVIPDASQGPSPLPCPHAQTWRLGTRIFLDPEVHRDTTYFGQRKIYRVVMCQACGVLQAIFDHAEVG